MQNKSSLSQILAEEVAAFDALMWNGERGRGIRIKLGEGSAVANTSDIKAIIKVHDSRILSAVIHELDELCAQYSYDRPIPPAVIRALQDKWFTLIKSAIEV